MQNTNKIEFSVSMCVYGGDSPNNFREAVESILNQTLLPKEIVLVVDGPVPKELDVIIKSYEDIPIFSVIRLEKNQGHGNARRIGLRACRYELVALMDADDISVVDRFEKQIHVFELDRTLSVVGGIIYEFIDSVDNVIGKRVVPETDVEIKQYMKKRCPMNQVTVMLKKADVDEVGGYIDWYCEEDYYLWLRLCLANKSFYNIQENLVNVRVGYSMYQRRGGWKYFKSEAKLQQFMRKKGMIGFITFFVNVLERLIVQILLPNRIRGWVFQKFARS